MSLAPNKFLSLQVINRLEVWSFLSFNSSKFLLEIKTQLKILFIQYDFIYCVVQDIHALFCI